MHALPEYIDPIILARSNTQLVGELPIAKMLRLEGLINSLKGKATVSLEFGIDAGGYYYIQGHIAAEVELICQRCLQPFMYNIDANIRLSPVKSDSECGKLPERYEPLLLEESSIALNTLVEEELVLNIPLIPKHNYDCVDRSHYETKDNEQITNPFDVLKNLKLK